MSTLCYRSVPRTLRARLVRSWPSYTETYPSAVAIHPIFVGPKRMQPIGTECELEFLFAATDRFPDRYLATFPDGSQSYLQSSEVEVL